MSNDRAVPCAAAVLVLLLLPGAVSAQTAQANKYIGALAPENVA
jgi:hypothetical protein